MTRPSMEMTVIDNRCPANYDDEPTPIPIIPTRFDIIIASAKKGALHGLIRGSATVIENHLKANRVPHATLWAQVAYCSGLFFINFAQRASETHGLNAAYQASVDTAYVLGLNTALNLVVKLLTVASESLKQRHATMAKGVETFSSLLPFSIFAVNAVNNGIPETAVALTAGTIAQSVVGKIKI